MKATDLIKELQEAVEKYGENLEVFTETPKFNAEEIHSAKSGGVKYVQTEELSDFPYKELIFEDWGENTGIYHGFFIVGGELLYIDG